MGYKCEIKINDTEIKEIIRLKKDKVKSELLGVQYRLGG